MTDQIKGYLPFSCYFSLQPRMCTLCLLLFILQQNVNRERLRERGKEETARMQLQTSLWWKWGGREVSAEQGISELALLSPAAAGEAIMSSSRAFVCSFVCTAQTRITGWAFSTGANSIQDCHHSKGTLANTKNVYNLFDFYRGGAKIWCDWAEWASCPKHRCCTKS